MSAILSESIPHPDLYFSVRGLYKAFDGKNILNGVDLDIRRGETLVLLGGSGGGKSVLVKHIATLMQADRGQVYVDGTDITHLNDRQLTETRLKIGMMFQDGALFDSLNVAENVAFPIFTRRECKRDELEQRVFKALDQVGLGDHLSKMPVDLSGGMRKRVALARALIAHPQAIFFDEPTSGLDPIAARLIDQLIDDGKQRDGITNVVITHDIESTKRIADRVVYLSKGKVLWCGTPDQLYRCEHEEIQNYLAAASSPRLGQH